MGSGWKCGWVGVDVVKEVVMEDSTNQIRRVGELFNGLLEPHELVHHVAPLMWEAGGLSHLIVNDEITLNLSL